MLKLMQEHTFTKVKRPYIHASPVQSETYGYIHRRFTKEFSLSKVSKDNPEFYQSLVEYGKSLDPHFIFSTITVNKNVMCNPHKDSKNFGITMIIALGEFTAGQLWLINEHGNSTDVNIKDRPYFFYGSEQTHSTAPWYDGDRYVIMYYNYGFYCPYLRPDTSDLVCWKELKKQGTYRSAFFDQVRGEKWVDIGANIGLFTRRCRMNGVEVIRAYEPQEINQEGAINKAVTHDGKDVTLYIAKRCWNSTTCRRVQGRPFVIVQSIKFEEAIEGADGCKMDIEGGELTILDLCDFKGLKKLVLAYHTNYDHSTLNYYRRMERLKTFFEHVEYQKFADRESLNFFPNELIVFCWN